MTNDIIIGRDDSDKKKLGDKGLVYIGKHYVKMGQTTSLSNRVMLDLARPHVILVSGKRGSGKSTSLGVIAEEMCNLPKDVSENLSIIMFDTMGIFWTMKYPNNREEELLRQWNLKTSSFKVNIYCPSGYFKEYKKCNIPVDVPFTLKTSELNAEDWCNVFGIELTSNIGILIERVISELEGNNYDINKLTDLIKKDKKADDNAKNGAENRFNSVIGWGLFDKNGTEIEDLIKPGNVSIIDLSAYTHISGSSNIKSIVISIISKKLLNSRIKSRKLEELTDIGKSDTLLLDEHEKKPMPLLWLMIDECLPKDSMITTENGLMNIEEVIKLVEVGKSIKVLSLDVNGKNYEYKEIEKTYRINKRELLKIYTETGDSLRCTPDHPILTDQGYISAINSKNIAIPLIYPHIKDKKLIIARLIGHIYGDGYLSTNKIVGFSGKGHEEDLKKIKEDLGFLGFSSSNIYTRITRSSIKDASGKIIKVIGISQELKASTLSWNFFKDLGLPIGEKAKSATIIPEWIMNSSKEEKAEFLGALMGSDGYGLSKAKNSKLDFNAIRISFNKIEKLEKESWKFASQICQLFNDLDIKVSSVKKKPGNIRVDSNKSIKIMITLSKSIDNTLRFINNIGFKYCKLKEIKAKKWGAYLKAYKEKLKNNRKAMQSALILKEGGLNLKEISNEINVEYQKLRVWSKTKSKLKTTWDFDDFDTWINKRVKKDSLYLNIISTSLEASEELFDITVKDNHNFLANGFIVHNCHEFLPRDIKTPATDALVQLLREGRQPGISLVLATQQPGEIHKDVITQTDIVISHRITAKRDIEALNAMSQSYLTADIQRYLNDLPSLKGSAIILDDNSERIYPVRIRPRMSWHGGETPSAIQVKRKELINLGL